jgi:hypothetical protein
VPQIIFCMNVSSTCTENLPTAGTNAQLHGCTLDHVRLVTETSLHIGARRALVIGVICSANTRCRSARVKWMDPAPQRAGVHGTRHRGSTQHEITTSVGGMQAIEDATTLEDLCHSVSTVGRGGIFSLPVGVPIASRLASAMHACSSPLTPSASMQTRSPYSRSPTASPTPAAMSSGSPARSEVASGSLAAQAPYPQAPQQPTAPLGDAPTAMPASRSGWGNVAMRTVQRSLQELLAQGAHQCPLQPVFRLEKPPPHALIFPLAAAGSTLCNGTIELPKDGFLVCSEACSQLTLQDMTVRGACCSLPATCAPACAFTFPLISHVLDCSRCACMLAAHFPPATSNSGAGGCVVCHGDGAEVRFQNVAFEGCCVVVLAGARVTLDRCSAVDANVFVVASGAHTQARSPHACGPEASCMHVPACALTRGIVQVSVSRGRVKACGQVAVAECGAAMWLREVQCRSMCIGGVQASGFGTALHLANCDISDAASAASDAVRNWVVRAMWLQGGAAGECSGCQFSNVGCGVTVMDLDTRANVTNCFAADNDRLGAEVARGATARFVGSEMSRSRMFKGAYVGGVGTRAAFVDCVFAENQQCALRVDAGAVASVTSCRLVGSRHFHGVDASGAGTRVVQLLSCDSTGNAQAGLSAQERGEVHLSGWESSQEVRQKVATDGIIAEGVVYVGDADCSARGARDAMASPSSTLSPASGL